MSDRKVTILGKINLLQWNKNRNRKVKITKLPIEAFLKAGEIEPRILEVLPAALLHYPQYFKGDIPIDLKEIISGNTKKKSFHGISIKKCLFWMKYPKPETYFKDW